MRGLGSRIVPSESDPRWRRTGVRIASGLSGASRSRNHVAARAASAAEDLVAPVPVDSDRVDRPDQASGGRARLRQTSPGSTCRRTWTRHGRAAHLRAGTPHPQPRRGDRLGGTALAGCGVLRRHVGRRQRTAARAARRRPRTACSRSPRRDQPGPDRADRADVHGGIRCARSSAPCSTRCGIARRAGRRRCDGHGGGGALISVALMPVRRAPASLDRCAAGARGARDWRSNDSRSPQETRMRWSGCSTRGCRRRSATSRCSARRASCWVSRTCLIRSPGLVGEYDGEDHKVAERHRATSPGRAFRDHGWSTSPWSAATCATGRSSCGGCTQRARRAASSPGRPPLDARRHRRGGATEEPLDLHLVRTGQAAFLVADLTVVRR